jgi:hypothetical protein
VSCSLISSNSDVTLNGEAVSCFLLSLTLSQVSKSLLVYIFLYQSCFIAYSIITEEWVHSSQSLLTVILNNIG